MNAAEIKLNLFREIDSLNGKKLEEAYQHMLNFFKSREEKAKLTQEEKNAIDEALKASKKGYTFSHDKVIQETRSKYPNLKFK